MKEHIIIYEPNQRIKMGILKTWIVMIKNIIDSRELIAQLFKRDFIAIYKKSFLGIAWIFILPIINIVSWVLMNKTGILKPGDVGIPYPAYVLLGSSIWALFMNFFKSATETLSVGQTFIMQVKFPHETLLIKQTAQQLASFILSFVLIIIVLMSFKVFPSWMIIFFPLTILPIFFLAAGIGLIVSVINIVAMDVSKGFVILFGLLMYVTPVIYSPNVKNETLQLIIDWNPLTYLIGSARDIIIYGRVEHFYKYMIASIFALLIFLFAWRLFYLSEDRVIEKMI